MNVAEYFVLIIFFVLGLVAFLASLFHFSWFFQTREAGNFVRYLGRNGARIFYGMLGLALMACGILGYLHWR